MFVVFLTGIVSPVFCNSPVEIKNSVIDTDTTIIIFSDVSVGEVDGEVPVLDLGELEEDGSDDADLAASARDTRRSTERWQGILQERSPRTPRIPQE